MKYHYQKPDLYLPMYGIKYYCNHPLYNICTLYLINGKGLAVIQQRFDHKTKHTCWTDIDSWLANDIYLNPRFLEYFKEKAETPNNNVCFTHEAFCQKNSGKLLLIIKFERKNYG